MVIIVRVHTLLNLVETLGGREVEVPLATGSTLADLLRALADRLSGGGGSDLFRPGTTDLQPHVRVMVNGRPASLLQDLDTVLCDQDDILLFPPAAGG